MEAKDEIKSETEANMECFIYLVIGEVVCHETDTARQLEKGEAFAEQNKTVFDVAMAMAKFYKEQLDMRMDAYERERKALEEVEKLKTYIKKVCAESSADIQKLDAENKQLKEELSDKGNHIEVLLGRIEKLELDKHSLDQVAKVFQSDLGKKDTEINELHKRILLLEAELRKVD